MEFKGFDKIPRLSRKAVVTEKIDGTNAQIFIPEQQPLAEWPEVAALGGGLKLPNDQWIWVGSRNRWLKPGGKDDNFGFCAWVLQHWEDLLQLGQGQHFGEWWGQGIGRNYGLPERRFSLFNTARWGAHNPSTPTCCSVVPVLGHVTLDQVDDLMLDLKTKGSVAAPGFMNPEGIIVYHEQQLYKKTFEHDQGKWSA